MAKQKNSADRSPHPSWDRALRPLLIVNTLLLIFVLACGCFLQSYGFFEGKRTLPETMRIHCMEKEKTLAEAYMRVYYRLYRLAQEGADDRNNERMALNAQYTEFKDHFSAENSNFIFAFEVRDPTNETTYRALSNAREDAQQTFSFADVPDSARIFGVDSLEKVEPQFRQMTIRYDLLPISKDSPRDGFYKAYRLDRLLDLAHGAIVALCVLSAVFLMLSAVEGVLIVRLHTRTIRRLDPRSMQELNGTPLYVLLSFYLLLCANGAYFLYKLWQQVSNYILCISEDVRPVIVAALLLALLIWATSLLVTTIVARLSSPRWWKRSVLYRAVNLPSVEQRLRMWLTIAVTAEATLLLALFMEENQIRNELQVALFFDALIMLALLLVAYVQGKSSAGIFAATHRIAAEKHGFIPTKGLRGQSLRHVRNINFLSRNAGEQMQRRFVNENFSTKLINSVSLGLRDPLTAVTQAVEQLRSGQLNEEQTKQRMEQINVYAQQLKEFIEDLLRIANASAGSTHVELVRTDVGMMIEQTMGEYFDRFARRNVELVQSLPDSSVSVPADGACMWTVFESVLDEFLLYAVPGTRVFLSAKQTDGAVQLCFRGTARMDAQAQTQMQLPNGSLNLPTAKVFAELQNGSFHYKYAQDILTIRLQFPLCAEDAADT